MRDIRILPEVLRDIADAAKWWYDEDGNLGLGDRFIATFYRFLRDIQQDGEIHRKIYHDFRKVIIRPFPYSVFYRLHENTWIVTLVIHSARRPSRTRKNLRNRK
jgi:hypothetical protein